MGKTDRGKASRGRDGVGLEELHLLDMLSKHLGTGIVA